jgi:chromosome segregation ATPase
MVKKIVKKTKIDLKETSPYSDIRQSLKEREIFIVKTFEKILGREPSSRELSYYKYGETEEEKIREELLDGDEHKKILEDAKESTKLKKKIEILESEKERLANLINDKAIEYRELTSLLQNKNEEIKKLREEESNIYNQNKELRKEKVDEILPGYSFEYNHSYSEPIPAKVSIKHKPDIFDKIREVLKIE